MQLSFSALFTELSFDEDKTLRKGENEKIQEKEEEGREGAEKGEDQDVDEDETKSQNEDKLEDQEKRVKGNKET